MTSRPASKRHSSNEQTGAQLAATQAHRNARKTRYCLLLYALQLWNTEAEKAWSPLTPVKR
jgi:hypothetical protein